MNKSIAARYSPPPTGGHALLELALVLPLVLLLSLVGLETAGALAAHQVATQLSRELASSAFRSACIKPNASSATVNSCLHDNVLEPFVDGAASIAPNAHLHVSLYKKKAPAEMMAHQSDGTMPTKFSENSFDTAVADTALSRAINQAISNYEVTVVAEVYIEPGDTPGSISGLWFLGSDPIYAATIM